MSHLKMIYWTFEMYADLKQHFLCNSQTHKRCMYIFNPNTGLWNLRVLADFRFFHFLSRFEFPLFFFKNPPEKKFR